jgi:hypothetical protein
MKKIIKSITKVKQKKKNRFVNKNIEEAPERKFYVSSTNIKSMRYNNATKDLEITFHRGNRTYLYADVPATIYLRLLNAKSKGEYFHKHIRFKYKYTEI